VREPLDRRYPSDGVTVKTELLRMKGGAPKSARLAIRTMVLNVCDDRFNWNGTNRPRIARKRSGHVGLPEIVTRSDRFSRNRRLQIGASRSLNREGADAPWRVFEVKCPQYIPFDVVLLNHRRFLIRRRFRWDATTEFTPNSYAPMRVGLPIPGSPRIIDMCVRPNRSCSSSRLNSL
jgi:hypothetical protein